MHCTTIRTSRDSHQIRRAFPQYYEASTVSDVAKWIGCIFLATESNDLFLKGTLQIVPCSIILGVPNMPLCFDSSPPLSHCIHHLCSIIVLAQIIVGGRMKLYGVGAFGFFLEDY